MHVKPATDAEIREIEQRIANGDDNPWSAYMIEALIARIKQEVSLNSTGDAFYKTAVAERNLAWHQLEDLRQQLNDEQQRSAERYQFIQRLKAQERILLEWQRQAKPFLIDGIDACVWDGDGCDQCEAAKRLLGEETNRA